MNNALGVSACPVFLDIIHDMKNMRMRGVGVILVCWSLVFLCAWVNDASAVTGINAQIPFGGTLNDADGDSVSGTYDMVFTIYDAPTGGSDVWTGTHSAANGNAVVVTDGAFHVLLGSGTGNALILDFNDDTYYLGVKIGADPEMVPRERLGASGYAINADMLDGVHASSFLLANELISIASSSVSSMLTLTQSGSGRFISGFDGSENELFSVLNTGRVVASSFEGTGNELSTFVGAIDVQSGDMSFFGGDVSIADGSGIWFGNENGLVVYQNTDTLGLNDLMIEPVGDATIDGYVSVTTPGALWLTPNNTDGCSTGCEPSFVLSDTGTAQLYNSNHGDPADRYFEINFTNGVRIPTGDVTVSSLGSGGTVSLSVNADGKIIQTPSDERLKQNIRPVIGALDTVAKLRGVRYEWKDAERFGPQTEIGFIAQELQPILPEVVREGKEYLSVNVQNIVAIVVEAIKELNSKVENYFARTEALEREVADLRAEIEMLKGGRAGSEEEQVSTNVTDEESIVPSVLEEDVVDSGSEPAPQAPAESLEVQETSVDEGVTVTE